MSFYFAYTYDALDGRDTLAYFLTSIILDAKNRKKSREQPKVFPCLQATLVKQFQDDLKLLLS